MIAHHGVQWCIMAYHGTMIGLAGGWALESPSRCVICIRKVGIRVIVCLRIRWASSSPCHLGSNSCEHRHLSTPLKRSPLLTIMAALGTPAASTDIVKLPKAVSALASGDVDLSKFTAEDVEKLSPKQRKDLQSVMLYAFKGQPDKWKEYEANRDESIRKFVMDCSMGINTCTSKTTVTHRKTYAGKEFWLTISQLSSPLYLNDTEHAEIVATDGRPRRPFQKSQALAQKGVEEFRYTVDEIHAMKKTTFEAGVENKCEMSTEHYDQVKAAMEEDFTTGPKKSKKQKTTTPPKKPHEIFQRLAISRSGCTKALSSIKQACDKATKDCSKVEDAKKKLMLKGWPELLGNHLSAEAAKVLDASAAAKQFLVNRVPFRADSAARWPHGEGAHRVAIRRGINRTDDHAAQREKQRIHH